jgi:hypothetical protein
MWQHEVQVDNLMRLVGGKNWRDRTSVLISDADDHYGFHHQ